MKQGVRIELDVDDVARRYLSGEGCVAIARAHFCHEHTIRQRLLAAGVPRHPRGSGRAVLVVDVALMCRQYEAGLSAQTIGALHYVSQKTVLARLRQAGVRMRPPGYRPTMLGKRVA